MTLINLFDPMWGANQPLLAWDDPVLGFGLWMAASEIIVVSKPLCGEPHDGFSCFVYTDNGFKQTTRF
jgi:hypothetical protein